VPIPGSIHNDEFGDIPPSMDFGDLALPPGAAHQVQCHRCTWTYTSLNAALSARALAQHATHGHGEQPTPEEERRLRMAGWIR